MIDADKMPQAPEHLPDDVREVWLELVTAAGADASRIVGPDLEAYAGQVARLRDAQRRIAAEGQIIEDPRTGKPIPHPALEIERVAQVEIRTWGNHFRPRGRRQ